MSGPHADESWQYLGDDWDDDETMVDLGGGMVVPLSELLDDEGAIDQENPDE